VDHCVDVKSFLTNKGKKSHFSVSDNDLINIQGVKEWSPKNFRESLSGKMWSKTFISFLDKLNRFLKIKLFPAVLGLLKYCFVHEKKILYVST
jgi:hypothetical protein